METNEEKNEKLDNKKILDEIDKLEDNENSEKIRLNNKIKNYIKYIVIGLIVIACIIGIISYFYINNKNIETEEILDGFSEYNSEEEFDEIDADEEIKSEEDLRKDMEKFQNQKNNISISDNIDETNCLNISLKNNNEEDIDNIYLYVVFYNESNKIIDIKEDFEFEIDSGSEYSFKFENLPTNYTRYETFINKDF